jgi:lysozyme family protein
MAFDQAYWSKVYGDLEADIARVERQTGRRVPIEIAIDVDRARFLIDAGATGEAIALLDSVSDRLLAAAGGTHRSIARGAVAGSATYANLDKLSADLVRETRFGSARLEITGEAEEAPPPPTRDGGNNTKVNRSTTYEDIREEYVRLFETAVIRADKKAEVGRMTDKIIANRAAYEAIEQQTSVPWYFVGLLHAMECSLSFKKHLHNGDSLTAKTWQVPAGRPKSGEPVYSFEESAIDALEYDKFAGKTDWPLAMMLYRLERYNGMGYRKKFAIASPYLWSFTNHHVRGKYVADGVWDPNAISKQIGAAVMLRDLVNRQIVSFEPVQQPAPAIAVAPQAPASPMPVPAPAPAQSPAPAPVTVPAAVPQQASTPAPVAAPAPQASPTPVPAPAAAAVPAAIPVPAAAVAAPAPSSPGSVASAIGAVAAAAAAPPPVQVPPVVQTPSTPPAAPPAAAAPKPDAPAPAPSGIAAAIGAVAAAASAPKPAAPAPLAPSQPPAITPSEPETTGT